MTKKLFVFKLFVFSLAAGMVITTTGCQTLRKKFTRKKEKKTVKEVIPVLEPIDYGLGVVNPQEKYLHHYGIWKVWQKELLRAFKDDDTNKRLEYHVAQIITQIETMQGWVVEDIAAELEKVKQEYHEVDADLKKSEKLQNRYLMRMKVERMGKRMRAEFGVDDLQETDYRMPL